MKTDKKMFRILINIKIPVYILVILLVISCNYRTPSRIRFEKNLNIEIPKDIEVVKDDYQSNIQDYSLDYEIRMSKEDCKVLTNSIRSSVYFNPNVVVVYKIDDSLYKDTKGIKGVWYKEGYGYFFENKWDRDIYTADVDTVKLTAKFSEIHN